MESMSISEFKATCLKVIERIRRTGESLTILKNGEPAAVVGPPPPSTHQAQFGCLKHKMRIEGDIISPLDEQGWECLDHSDGD
jgi:antitoxin (DNA-binding transcriptional repressor) of toxin-antitoxin stability system